MSSTQNGTITLEDFIRHCQERSTYLLETALEPFQNNDSSLHQAMRYSCLNGGKRIRPILVFASAQACGLKLPFEPNMPSPCDALAGAIECIHTYSLIHDDLPAMDDDELRRGKPTCHIAFDEATAILTGDALQCLAMELAAYAPELNAEQARSALQLLSRASGALGMVLGQAIDLAHVDKTLSAQALESMHAYKTGALIECAVALGALAANATDEQSSALGRYSTAIGLAFQVQDDILDVTSSTDTLGKPQGADAALNKPTYVSILGLEGAKSKAQELLVEARESLAGFGDSANTLRDLAVYIIERNH
ncbi:MAG: geranylgeranyl diphosphate synthase type II [Flavobacteriales bacterium]|jgi:geranylgeranyl diphosphate synthase type II